MHITQYHQLNTKIYVKVDFLFIYFQLYLNSDHNSQVGESSLQIDT